MENILLVLAVVSSVTVGLLAIIGGGHMFYKFMRSFDPIDAERMQTEEDDRAWDAQLDRLDDKEHQTWLNSIQAGRDAEANALADGKSPQEARVIREQAKRNYMKEMVV